MGESDLAVRVLSWLIFVLIDQVPPLSPAPLNFLEVSGFDIQVKMGSKAPFSEMERMGEGLKGWRGDHVKYSCSFKHLTQSVYIYAYVYRPLR